jgi:dGTP triphosphohydrolase
MQFKSFEPNAQQLKIVAAVEAITKRKLTLDNGATALTLHKALTLVCRDADKHSESVAAQSEAALDKYEAASRATHKAMRNGANCNNATAKQRAAYDKLVEAEEKLNELSDDLEDEAADAQDDYESLCDLMGTLEMRVENLADELRDAVAW